MFLQIHTYLVSFVGVRALLIDKDQSPKWIPPTIEGVTQQMVDEFFAPLDPEKELKVRFT